MTTEPQQPRQPQAPGQEAIPQYFLEFVQENARQHTVLADSISTVRECVAEVKGAVGAIRNFTIATFGAMFTLMLIVLTAALRGDLP
ncbi:MAG: hypothetical protein OXL97_12775 [Chloroflexota bacterium]|nr:hypothetical protein [Chloroflexota bacterium]MDE2885087.1 hypothetical protein [Chloroflexota bacterium]